MTMKPVELELRVRLKSESGEDLGERARCFTLNLPEGTADDATVAVDAEIHTGGRVHTHFKANVPVAGGRIEHDVPLKPTRTEEVQRPGGGVYHMHHYELGAGVITIAAARVVAAAKPRKRRVSYPAGNPVGFAKEIERTEDVIGGDP